MGTLLLIYVVSFLIRGLLIQTGAFSKERICDIIQSIKLLLSFTPLILVSSFLTVGLYSIGWAAQGQYGALQNLFDPRGCWNGLIWAWIGIDVKTHHCAPLLHTVGRILKWQSATRAPRFQVIDKKNQRQCSGKIIPQFCCNLECVAESVMEANSILTFQGELDKYL